MTYLMTREQEGNRLFLERKEMNGAESREEHPLSHYSKSAVLACSQAYCLLYKYPNISVAFVISQQWNQIYIQRSLPKVN